MSLLIIGGTGFIGSRLYQSLKTDRHVSVIDVCHRGNPGNIPHLNIDYADISRGKIACYDDIILLAAHSSVADAQRDPSGAFRNNVVAFQRLLEMLSPEQRLIYASSSSVYSGFGSTAASEDMVTGNMYDASKYMNDMLATMSGKRCYGLRFGTVCGVSPNMRNDLMLNKMVMTAVNDGYVQIANPKIRRPILGLNDLTRAVTCILDGDGAPGIYNLASLNSQVATLGATVAAELDVPLILGEPSATYDFVIQSTKFQEAYDFQFEETAASIVRELVAYGSDSRSDDSVRTDLALSGV